MGPPVSRVIRRDDEFLKLFSAATASTERWQYSLGEAELGAFCGHAVQFMATHVCREKSILLFLHFFHFALDFKALGFQKTSLSLVLVLL